MLRIYKRFRNPLYIIFVVVSLLQLSSRSSFRTFVLQETKEKTYRKGEAHVHGGNPIHIPPDFFPLLDQPFYIYEELLWFDGTYQRTSKVTNLLQEAEYLTEYSEDLWFSLAALRHPMRTMDPVKAKLFVVPLLTHLVVNPVARSFCWDGMCNGDLLTYADAFLRQSKWFRKRQGADHILVGTHPNSARLAAHESLRQCHAIALENQKWNSPSRYALPGLRWVEACSASGTDTEKTTELIVMSRNDRVLESYSWSQLIGTNTKVLALADCDALVKARFGLYLGEHPALHGDSHVLSLLQGNVVPIFTNHEQYKALPDWIDWESLSYFADASLEETQFVTQVKAILADQRTYQQKFAKLQQNHDLYNWRTLVPFDTYMYVLSTKLQNKQTAESSPYPALKLSSMSSSIALDTSAKETWCGASGYHSSCGACPTNFGAVPSEGCGGNCHWCEYGLESKSLAISLMQGEDPNRCFPQSEACFEPEIETIVADLAQPASPWRGEPLGFCVEGDCSSSDCTEGILLAKTFKTASTTAAAVSIHLAERVAQRKGFDQRRCKYTVHHKFSRENLPKLRNPQNSVLWSSVRDPGPRALSAYFFYRVGHKQVQNTDEKTMKFLELVKNHQFVQLRTERGASADGCCQTAHQITEDSNQLFARILREEILPLYDFVAVTERMDESLVALKMLWGLNTGDIVVSAAKAGEYSYNWNPKGTCFKIPRTVKTEIVMDYIKTDFQHANGDFLLHAVMNRSLDLTIDALGRDRFNREMEEYKKLKAYATGLCQNNATFPCSNTGEWQSSYVNSCYEYDVGCGYKCIDSILDRYESGELSLP